MGSADTQKLAESSAVHVQRQDAECESPSSVYETWGDGSAASNDEKDMYRLGKRQVLKRRFTYFSLAGYVLILGNTWEFAIVDSIFSLENGGTAGTIWMSIIVCIGMMFAVWSMAEISSMAPTSGGQYHWVSEIAPRGAQKQLSYAVGWMSVLAWQAGMPSCAYIFAQQVLAIIALCRPGYEPPGWHGALLTIGSAVVTVLLSIFVMQKLSISQGIGIAAHVLGFFAFVIILWAMGPRADAHDVFFQFQNTNGWSSVGAATLVSFIGPATTFIAGDAAAHLAEELQDASYVLPRAMVMGSVLNFIAGLIAIITFMFNIGELDDSIYQYGGQPWVAVIYRVTGSKPATIIMVLIVAINFFCLQINQVMATSRQLFAFARDKGLPFHQFLSKVDKDNLPRNSVTVSLLFTTILALIIIGSSSAFNIILSFSGACAYMSYIIVLGCLIYRRFDGNEFPPTKYSLGRWGLGINCAALVFFSVGLVLNMFPPVPHPTVVDMNWAPVMFIGALVISGFWYFFKGRHQYDGPVEYVRKLR